MSIERERTARGTWKSSEQGALRLNMASRLNRAMRGKGGRWKRREG